jgi:hypothetical protein
MFGAPLLDDDENPSIWWADAAPSQTATIQEDHYAGKDFTNWQHPFRS